MSSSDAEQIKSFEAMSPDAPSRKRKTLHDGPTLEIDLDAPEPPSKKALRKLKKQQKADKKAAKEKKKEEKEKQSKEEKVEESSDDDTETTTKGEERKRLIEKEKQIKQFKKAAEEDFNAKSKRSNYGVWIGNLSFSTTKADLRAFITSRAGLSPHNITRLHMPEGARNAAGKSQNRGFAYVDFDKAECVPAVVALSESDFNGRRCLIKDALSFEGRPEKKGNADGDGKAGGAKSAKPASRKVFVGNLAYDVNQETLELHFAKCGTISNTHVATFEDSGKCKGYAWVEFEDVESAEAAVRGFVKVPEDDDDTDEEGSDSSSSSSDDEGSEESKMKKAKFSKKKPVMKKIWVNRLFGRPLRVEFAEDSETRYNKRFGKGAKRPHGDGVRGDENAITELADGASSGGKKRPVKKYKYNTSRYSEQTVQRLTGGIVEAQGKKISFD
ncbi:hypothetical protein KEM54_004262 [Ascosphaera aggregata]|nr:hypothetical protein KEM54_004262 [Ascosphaera aggregata]